MRCSILTAAVWGMVMAASAVAAPRSPQAVTLVLDCSRSMERGLAAADRGPDAVADEELSRFEAARESLFESLDKLAVDGDRRVGLVFFGHRLGWEPEVSEPDLIDNSAYLEQTLGFEVLGTLVPGDDVELVRHLARFEPKDLAKLEPRIKAIKPWGEDPLFLALTRTIDTFERPGQSDDRRIVVLTDGNNFQGELTKSRATKDQVLEALERKQVPVYIIRIGDEKLDRQTESELKQIAKKSGGEYARALTAADLKKQLKTALEPSTAPVEEETHQISTTDDAAKAASTPAKLDAPKFAKLHGTVTMFGRPIRKAKVTLEGADARNRVTTDDEGNFNLGDVPAGTYTLRTEVVVKNITRRGEKRLTIDPATSRSPSVEIELD